jgi:uncharacterized protein YecT (DUF1311 family)
MSEISETWELKNNPIDNQMNSCLANPEGQTTGGMRNCLGAAYNAFDLEINKTYDTLMKHDSPEDQKGLAADQKEWLADREKQFRRIDEIYKKDGCIYPVLSLSDKTEMERIRAIDLHSRLLVNENSEKP